MTTSFLFAGHPSAIPRVREALDRACYSAEAVRRIVGENVLRMQGFTLLNAGDPLALRRRTEGGSALETLVRLFLLGLEVDPARAARALAPLTPAEWAEAGLVALGASGVTGRVHLLPYEVEGCDRVVAYDTTDQRRQHPADFVIGVGLASMSLAGRTVRPPVGRALDLGSGNGVQALHASHHAGSVVATDRNARAVAFTEFTMALNGISNVVARQGDLFEPVEGERFGLVVSNPPFVISPELALEWRDGGLADGGICRRIVQRVPHHLDEGGWCQLLADWPHGADGEWKERLASWFEGTGCDVWVIQRDVQEAFAYASRWIRYEEPGPEKAEVAFDAWMDYYRQADVDAVGHGLITMRRSARPTTWVRIDEVTPDPEMPCGEAIRATFDRLAWLAERPGDERLLGTPLLVADELSRHRRSVPSGGRWAVEETELRLDRGLRRSARVDPELARALAGCDGVRTVGSLLQEVAGATGVEIGEMTSRILPDVRHLIELGFLLPAADGAATALPGADGRDPARH
jgi:hypothetical protein